MADITVPTSSDWKKLRNKAKIDGGAVKGLNIGKAFDEVHKAAKGGAFDTLEPTEALSKKLAAYKTAMRKKSKDIDDDEYERRVKWAKEIESKIEPGIDQHLSNLKSHYDTVKRAPQMAEKCADVVKTKMDIEKVDPDTLKRNLVQLGQLTSAMQVTVDTLKKEMPSDHEYQGAEAEIRDAKKKINEMESVLFEEEKGKIKPDGINSMWTKRQEALAECYSRLAYRLDTKAAEFK